MTLDDAITALQVHARQLEAVQTIAAAIKDKSSLDQLVGEANVRLSAVNDEVSKATARLDSIRGEVDAASARIADLKAKGERIIDDAKRVADGLRADGQAAHDAIVAQAEADASAKLIPLKDAIKSAQEVFESLSERNRELQAMNVAKAALVDELEAKAAKLRDFIKGLAVE